ncbi:hypothetical protein BFP97_16435 [Roseivirga sp. 4D4]|uniref:hypothetical protein n=1 Tax=Roseivirga sp. 4D4 TaxID=1889784 RepID=UPI0008534548|nr:hypothetical protein [Roseivirga sp. 4D4]OEK03012.1 hypothetical protein BFP97_16435 [Roseivirga sp. 4D4]
MKNSIKLSLIIGTFLTIASVSFAQNVIPGIDNLRYGPPKGSDLPTIEEWQCNDVTTTTWIWIPIAGSFVSLPMLVETTTQECGWACIQNC